MHSGRYGGAVRNANHEMARLVASLHDKDGRIIGEYRALGLRPYTLEKARQFGFDQPFLEACL